MIWMLLGAALADAPADVATLLDEAWRAAREDARWRSPYAAERSAVREASGLLVQDGGACADETLERVRRVLEPADFQLDVLVVGAERIAIVREGHESRGAGLFAMRCGPARPIVWQAPHALHDTHTGEIVRHLFVESGARAAMWNTVHRYRSTPRELKTDPVHPADVTREHGSLFQAATVGFVVADPRLRVVQVHGFAAGTAPHAAILSTGDPDAPPTALSAALAPVFGDVAAFGEDVERLGGTTNVQGQMLRKWPEARFLHVELSPDARALMLRDADLRARFARTVADAEW